MKGQQIRNEHILNVSCPHEYLIATYFVVIAQTQPREDHP